MKSYSLIRTCIFGSAMLLLPTVSSRIITTPTNTAAGSIGSLQRLRMTCLSKNRRSSNTFFLTSRRQAFLSIRGGNSNETINDDSMNGVTVNPSQSLPPSIAGACLTAFSAGQRLHSSSPSPPPSTASSHIYDANDTDDQNGNVDEEVAVTSVMEGAEMTSSKSSKSGTSAILAKFQQRLLPSIIMIALLGCISYYLKEDGLIILTLFLQIGMYNEVTNVIGGEFPHFVYKWWWFATASLTLNAPRVLRWATNEISGISLGMIMAGIVSSIVQFNVKGAQVEEFRDFLREAAVCFLGMLLVVVPSSFWISTLEEFGMKWVGLPAALVIVNDTMAYLFGITLGKHPLLPVISPNKTWEGFLGATASTFLAAYYIFDSKRDAVVLSLATSLIGPFGGFMASMVKRAYNQKDFGNLIPGHGGLVDRLDCQLILAPIVFLYLKVKK